MSNLKHLTRDQLLEEKSNCERYIGRLRGKMNNQETRLVWINTYLTEKEKAMNELPKVGSEVVFVRALPPTLHSATNTWREGDALEVMAHREVGSTKVAICWNLRDLTVSGVVAECLKPKLHPQVEALSKMTLGTSPLGEQDAEMLFEQGCRVPQELTPDVLLELWGKVWADESKVPEPAKKFAQYVAAYVKGDL